MRGFGWPSLAKPLQPWGVGLFPLGEERGRGLVERGELGVAEDGGLHLGDGKLQLAVAGAVGLFEQGGADAGDDLPVAVEVINIALGNAAAQVAVDVLHVLRLGAVNVARQVEVVVVLRVGNFLDGHEARVAGYLGLPGEGVHDPVDVLFAQAVFVAVLDEALGGVDHEDALAGGGVFLVEHQDAGGDAGAVKEVGREADDPLEVAGADELLADDGLGIAPEEYAVGKDAGRFARALHRADDVEQVGVIALLLRRLAPGEALEGVAGPG